MQGILTMAYDQGLAERIRDLLQEQDDLDEKPMFGGLCFMLGGNMCCGIVGDTLMARVGPQAYEACLQEPYVSAMDFTGKPLAGLVYVAPEGVAEDADLARWVQRCEDFVRSLPPK
jgi:TfoX/Sxy family transcriptional regulator of competence genes